MRRRLGYWLDDSIAAASYLAGNNGKAICRIALDPRRSVRAFAGLIGAKQYVVVVLCVFGSVAYCWLQLYHRHGRPFDHRVAVHARWRRRWLAANRRWSSRSGATCCSRRTRPRWARSPRSRWPASIPRCGICAAAVPAVRCTSRRAARRRRCRSTPPRAAGCMETEALVEDASAARAAGFGGCKLKVGRRPQEDVARLAAVRAAVGPGVRDDGGRQPGLPGGRGDPPRPALRTPGPRVVRGAASGRRCRRPCAPRAGHLAADRGRQVALRHQPFRDYLQRGACSVVQVDVARIGGITPWLKVAHMAEAFNVAGVSALPDGTPCRARAAPCRMGAGWNTSPNSMP